jgi:hypothetical protein
LQGIGVLTEPTASAAPAVRYEGVGMVKVVLPCYKIKQLNFSYDEQAVSRTITNFHSPLQRHRHCLLQ